MVITKKKILKTVLLPEYLPRLKQLFGSGFGNLAYLIAVVYNTVRILPNNHPYLKPDKKGKYSIRQVIAEAANNISLKKENIDQIIVFFSIIAALIILFIQVVLLAFALLIPKSYAQTIPDNILEFFVTPSPDDDVAFHLLNLVFGIPEFFGGTAAVTEPIHEALHSLFEFYSYGILIVGTFIIIYMVITTIAETAQSGIPFGRRFNKAWTPIRIVLFFALILPITLGINSAQYVALLSAKLGSGLASQGWILYNDVIAENNTTLTGEEEQNIATPKKQNLMHLPAFMMVVKTCSYAYTASYNDEDFPPSWEPGPLPWAIREAENHQWVAVNMLDTTYETLVGQSPGKDIFIVFGVQDYDLYTQHPAAVAPLCGSLALKFTDASQPGAAVIRAAYYRFVTSMWNGTGGDLYERLQHYSQEYARLGLPSVFEPRDPDLPSPSFRKEWEDYFNEEMEGAATGGNQGGVIAEAVDVQITQTDWDTSPEIRNLGWAGAGIWYNRIAEYNGSLIAALRATPVPQLYPRVMETIETSTKGENVATNPFDRFTKSFAPGTPAIFMADYESEISRALNYAYTFWHDNEKGDNPDIPTTNNAFLDIINAVLGTQGLFEMCRNTNIHPLAQLSAVGKSMIDNSIKAFGVSVLFGLFGVQPLFAATTDAVSSFFGTIASVGLLIGFILFYVLPFMPFIYFFFGVGGWIKTIFEAMVAMPLWALAHLRIDGEGVMGDAAIGGYYLIFEIFIRPILIVFGLLASIIIFAAMVKTLNQVFHMVLTSVAGADPNSTLGCFQAPNGAAGSEQVINEAYQQESLNESYRGPIDEFFFTILYTIIVYMIGTSCFKLIDGIPNHILRWINAEVPSFSDNAGDAAEGLMKYVTIGGSQFGSQLGASLGGLGAGVKADARDAIKNIT